MAYRQRLGEFRAFQGKLIRAGVRERPGTHHEFVRGGHGEKLDFGVLEETDPLFEEWMRLTALAAMLRRTGKPDFLLGVADGTNRNADHAARLLGARSLHTARNPKGIIAITEESAAVLAEAVDPYVLVVEDVGTTGQSAEMAAVSAKKVIEASAKAAGRPAGGLVEIQFTWVRDGFPNIKTPNYAMFGDKLPTYTPRECAIRGLCAAGSILIPYPRGEPALAGSVNL